MMSVITDRSGRGAPGDGLSARVRPVAIGPHRPRDRRACPHANTPCPAGRSSAAGELESAQPGAVGGGDQVECSGVEAASVAAVPIPQHNVVEDVPASSGASAAVRAIDPDPSHTAAEHRYLLPCGHWRHVAARRCCLSRVRAARRADRRRCRSRARAARRGSGARPGV
jgi:hypothetical protein